MMTSPEVKTRDADASNAADKARVMIFGAYGFEDVFVFGGGVVFLWLKMMLIHKWRSEQNSLPLAVGKVLEVVKRAPNMKKKGCETNLWLIQAFLSRQTGFWFVKHVFVYTYLFICMCKYISIYVYIYI